MSASNRGLVRLGAADWHVLGRRGTLRSREGRPAPDEHSEPQPGGRKSRTTLKSQQVRLTGSFARSPRFPAPGFGAFRAGCASVRYGHCEVA
jgi:hypothetical protein